MSTNWAIFIVAFAVSQLFINFLFFMAIIGMSNKIDIYWKAVQTLAQISDKNFSKAGEFIDGLSQFIIQVFGLDIPKMQQVDKASEVITTGSLKN